MEHKHYNTAGRGRVIAFLRENAIDTPKSAEEIYTGLCADADAPGYSSVYRLLSKLTAEGQVRRLRAPAPAKGYLFQYTDAHSCHAHFHLHCLSCGAVTHMECDCGEEISAHLLREHGFTTDLGRTVFYGRCAKCTEAIKGGTV